MKIKEVLMQIAEMLVAGKSIEYIAEKTKMSEEWVRATLNAIEDEEYMPGEPWL